jgi:fucose 4-O-acetylase-like acetyltransferase
MTEALPPTPSSASHSSLSPQKKSPPSSHVLTPAQLQSRVIEALRFPLIIGVLLMHTRIQGSESGWFIYVGNLISKIMAHVTVPLFFIISGFLFFYKTETFSSGLYLKKIKKRAWSLLLPYVFWISLWLLFYFILVQVGLIRRDPLVNFDLNFLFHAFLDFEKDADCARPIVGQLWFLRDLMVVGLFSPVLYLGIKKLGVTLLFVFGALWLLDHPNSGIFVQTPISGAHKLTYWALFFFSFGAWFSINKLLFSEIFMRFRNISFIVYPLVVLADLLTRSWLEWNFLIHRICILVGVLFFVNLAVCLILRKEKKNKMESEKNLVLPSKIKAGDTSEPLSSGTAELAKGAPKRNGAVFFVYAAHSPAILLILDKLVFKPLNPQNDFLLAFCYFSLLAIQLAVTLSLYSFCNRFFPRFAAAITGEH